MLAYFRLFDYITMFAYHKQNYFIIIIKMEVCNHCHFNYYNTPLSHFYKNYIWDLNYTIYNGFKKQIYI